MSALTDKLLFQIRAARLPSPILEYRFAKHFNPPRMWRFDLCWPEWMLAAEVEGGIFVQGRHGRGAGMIADMEKYNAAVLAGWRLIRVSDRHINKGTALVWITEALSAAPKGLEALAGANPGIVGDSAPEKFVETIRKKQR